MRSGRDHPVGRPSSAELDRGERLNCNRRRGASAIAVFAAAALVASTTAHARTCTAVPALTDAGDVSTDVVKRDLVILDQALSDAVRDLGQVLGTPVAVSKRVEGRITGRRWHDHPCAVLEAVARDFQLQLYHDGLTLHVSTAAEAETVMIVLSHVSGFELGSRLAELGIDDPRYPLRPSEDGAVVRVSGPPRYVALVKEAASAIEHASSSRRLAPGVTRAGAFDIVRGYTLRGVEP